MSVQLPQGPATPAATAPRRARVTRGSGHTHCWASRLSFLQSFSGGTPCCFRYSLWAFRTSLLNCLEAAIISKRRMSQCREKAHHKQDGRLQSDAQLDPQATGTGRGSPSAPGQPSNHDALLHTHDVTCHISAPLHLLGHVGPYGPC